MCRELIAERHRRVRRRGPARRDPRLRGQARLRAAAAHLLARHRVARLRHYNMTVDTTAALARVAAAEGADDEARRALPRDPRALGGQRRPPLRASAACAGRPAFFAAQRRPRRRARLRRGADPHRRRRPGTPTRSPRSRTRSPRRRCSRATPDTAAEQLARAVELHRDARHAVRARADRAARRRRAGRGGRARARRSSASATPTARARKLGARPLAAEAAREVAALGESVVARLGARAAADADGGGLSRREREVVRLRRRRAARTARSRRTCSSARARSTCTCATSCASSTAARASRPPAARASSG